MDVKNDVCIITGAAQGLGKAFAKVLLDNGAKVCISDLKDETGKPTLEEFENKYGKEHVCFVKCDVTKEDQFEALFDQAETYFKVNCIDLLVNNAGINTNFGWKKCMEVNIMGVMTGTDIALQRMKKVSKKGSIVNTASMAGIVTGMGEDMIGYSVSKHGVVALTRTLAMDYKHHEVSIKAICPAWADTEIVSSARDHAEDRDKIALTKSIKGQGGLMTPEYVAEGFYKLVTKCDNGTVIWAIKDTPFLIIPDDAEIKTLVRAVMAKLLGKITGTDLITVFHQKMFFLGFMILLILLCNLFF